MGERRLARRTRSDPGRWFTAAEIQKAHAYNRGAQRLNVAFIAVQGLVLMLHVLLRTPDRLREALGGVTWYVEDVVVVVWIAVTAWAAGIPADRLQWWHKRRWAFDPSMQPFVRQELSDLVGLTVFAVLSIALVGSERFRFGDERRLELKGLTGAFTVFTVEWRDGESAERTEAETAASA